jgi:hypothetical protein
MSQTVNVSGSISPGSVVYTTTGTYNPIGVQVTQGTMPNLPQWNVITYPYTAGTITSGLHPNSLYLSIEGKSFKIGACGMDITINGSVKEHYHDVGGQHRNLKIILKEILKEFPHLELQLLTCEHECVRKAMKSIVERRRGKRVKKEVSPLTS